MKSVHIALLASALIATTPFAWAHDNATLDSMQSPNGGQLRMAGPYHFELLIPPSRPAAAGTTLVVVVTDHAGAQVPTAGATGTATVLVGGKKTTVALAPEGDHRMRGEGSFTAAADMKVIVSIKLSGATTESARFTPRIVGGAGAQRVSP